MQTPRPDRRDHLLPCPAPPLARPEARQRRRVVPSHVPPAQRRPVRGVEERDDARAREADGDGPAVGDEAGLVDHRRTSAAAGSRARGRRRRLEREQGLPGPAHVEHQRLRVRPGDQEVVWRGRAVSAFFGPPAEDVSRDAADRRLGAHVYDAVNGGPVLFQHLFWYFGHPEVYVIALPFFGIITEIIPVFSRKPVFGYATLVYATIAIGALSMAVWAHHMFVT